MCPLVAFSSPLPLVITAINSNYLCTLKTWASQKLTDFRNSQIQVFTWWIWPPLGREINIVLLWTKETWDISACTRMLSGEHSLIKETLLNGIMLYIILHRNECHEWQNPQLQDRSPGFRHPGLDQPLSYSCGASLPSLVNESQEAEPALPPKKRRLAKLTS